MQSYSIRLCPQFNITSNIDIKYKTKDKVIGSISPTENTIIMNRISFSIFDCKYYRSVNKDIFVDGTPYNEYQEVNTFKLYYSQVKQLILTEASTDVASSFLKYLSAQENITMTREDFDFIKLSQNNTLVHQIWFTTDETNVKSKGFNGIQVNRDVEANKAILEGKATYIKVDIDVNNIKRTIGFSKKSAIIIINKNNLDQSDLSLVIDTYFLYKDLI